MASKGLNGLTNVSSLCKSELSANLTSSATTITINSASTVTTWPTANFVVRIDNEIIFCDSRSGTTLTVNASGRGYASTTAAAHNQGAEIRVVTSHVEMQAMMDSLTVVDIDTSAAADSVVVDSSGNVGIGTASPSANGGGTYATLVEIEAASGNAALAINSNTADADILIGRGGLWEYRIGNNHTGSYFRIASADTDGAGADGDVMRIADGTDDVEFLGNVGIGVSAPTAQRLHLGNGGSGDVGMRFDRTGSSQFDWDLVTDGGNFQLKGGGDGAPNTIMYWESGGNVGFGTDSPTATTGTQVVEITGSAPELLLDADTGTNPILAFGENGARQYWMFYNAVANRFELSSTDVDGAGADGDIIRIDDGTDDVHFLGNVGVGVSPGTLLDISGSVPVIGNSFRGGAHLRGTSANATYADVNKIIVESGGTSDGLFTGGLHFTRRNFAQQGEYGSGIRGVTVGTTLQDNEVEIYTSNSGAQNAARVRVDKNGNVGVGTDSPASGLGINLHVANGSGNGTITVDGSNVSRYNFYASGVYKYQWYYSVSNTQLALNSTDTDGGGTDADVIRIPDGQLTVDGNATFDDNAFDWVCGSCYKSWANEGDWPGEKCACGGTIDWHDDAGFLHKLTHTNLGQMDPETAKKAEAFGIIKRYKDGQTFVSMNKAPLFNFSAIAQLWEENQSLKERLSIVEARVSA